MVDTFFKSLSVIFRFNHLDNIELPNFVKFLVGSFYHLFTEFSSWTLWVVFFASIIFWMNMILIIFESSRSTKQLFTLITGKWFSIMMVLMWNEDFGGELESKGITNQKIHSEEINLKVAHSKKETILLRSIFSPDEMMVQWMIETVWIKILLF